MKNSIFFFLLLLPLSAFAQNESSTYNTTNKSLSDADVYRIIANDKFLALVPGAVQLRRQWTWVAIPIWGCMATSGGIAIYEQAHIVKLQHEMENDPSSANWYDEQIRKSTKIRNGSLIALGGVYVANYISALLLPDKDPRTMRVSAYADSQGAVGLTLAFNF